jgi:hypothetical protein
VETGLPFKIKGFASDGGSEFLNKGLWAYFNNREDKIPFVRTRPDRKNDNAHVEQKNWTHVRQLLGYDRLDRKNDVIVLNDLYQNYWLILWNFFTPVMKLKSKIRDGHRVKRIYDEPRTPFDRLLASEYLSQDEKRTLAARKENLNPFELRAELNERLNSYLKTVGTRNRQKPLLSKAPQFDRRESYATDRINSLTKATGV